MNSSTEGRGRRVTGSVPASTIRTLLTVRPPAAPSAGVSLTGNTRGVWESDAPDGYVALVVTNTAGRQLLRVEIASDVYSVAWIDWLERWLRRFDCGVRIVR